MRWIRRFWTTLRPDHRRREIDREISFHLAERIDDLRAEGFSADDARRVAERRFGNRLLHADRIQDVSLSLWLDSFVRDARYAVRALARTPIFTTTVVLTLALGIGANTAVFSALDAVLLRPLPFPEADRLVALAQKQVRTAEDNIAPIRLEEWHRLNTTFESMTGFYTEDVSDTTGEWPERVRRAWVAPRFLEVWRVSPLIGRGFTDDEHRVGGRAAVLISERFWRTRLGQDANVIGRTIRIGTASTPILGVMPDSFRFVDRDVDLWFPVAVDYQPAQSRLATWFNGIGRLKPGVTIEQARANLDAIQAELANQYPDTDRGIGVQLAPLKETTIAGVRRSLWLLFGGVSILLLITCTNIAGLLLARGAQRHHEMSVRLSLGASRIALAAQMFVETLLLALAGAALGIAFALGIATVLRPAAANVPRIDEAAIDWRILLYTLVSAAVVAILCGVLPAWQAGRSQHATRLKEGARTQVSARHRLQWLLVGAQVALSLTLLAGAGLLVRSLHQLSRVDAGFDTRGVLTFRISGDFGETANYGRMTARIDTAIASLAGLPEAERVATAGMLPGVPGTRGATFALIPGNDDEQRMVAESRLVSPEYFATMRIPLLEGTLCRRQPQGATREMMVNRSFVTRYLGARGSPLGLHLTLADGGTRVIMGVVADARELGLDRDPAPTAYSCISAPHPTPNFLMRASGDPTRLVPAVRARIKALEPLRSVYDIAPLEERIDVAFAQNRLRTVLLAFFAIAAVSLACVGLYGTLSYIVNLRRREIGLRLALGAVRTAIMRQFLAKALMVVTIACASGFALLIAFARALSGMLFGVSPFDPTVLSLVVAAVIVVSTVAALIPAMRASLVDPVTTLRE